MHMSLAIIVRESGAYRRGALKFRGILKSVSTLLQLLGHV